ncbi:threonine aspartase 1 [Halyomorpha halys]|uniref:threonine aspartase 1 n=1 Tax=Halyomorpha halys TaxID=286706 RepID=UPI0006D4F5AA|nr:threonine aspartase 1-like [Halyomorpha halys]
MQATIDRDNNIFSYCQITIQKLSTASVAESPIKEVLEHAGVTSKLLDTVGAIVVDSEGRVAASCSSGGIVLKHPGRVGQAGTYGCGCWAQNYGTGRAVATSVTGCGEDLIKTCLAREAANSLIQSAHATVAINNTIRSFLDSPFLGKYSEKLCGIIAIESESSGRGEFTWGHTTPSMAIGFMSVGQRIPKSHISRLPLGAKPGSTVIIEGTPV